MDSTVQLLHSRADSLAVKFQQGGGSSCIDEAIDLDRKALELCPPSHPERSVSLTQLAVHLGDRYNQLGNIRDLEVAIDLDREALGLRPQGDPDRSMSLNNLAVCLSTRYKQLGVMTDLDSAIVLGRETLDRWPKGHADRSYSLDNLALCLSTRYNQLGVTENLDEAIVLGREALDLRPKGHPDRWMSLNNLAVRLSTHYKQFGLTEDLGEAIVLHREALDLFPKGRPNRSTSLKQPCNLPLQPVQSAGGHEGSREALNLCPEGHPNRSMSLNNLAVDLFTRYKQLGVMEDVNEAIVVTREALDLLANGHPDRSAPLNNFAVYLSTRYSELGVMQDLDEAIVLNREALYLCQKGHPNRAAPLNNLGIRLSTRYEQLGVMEDLDEAIVLYREALDLRPKGHPERSTLLNNLAVHLSTRHNQLGVMEDLNEAIVLDREALDLRPGEHPQRSMSLDNLARHLGDRFAWLRQPKDQEELFSLYAQLVHLSPYVSSSDLYTARAWIRIAEYFQHPTILLAYETSLRLLIQHLTALPSSPRHLVVLRDLSQWTRSQLVSGRGVFWSQLTRLRSPLDDVIASGVEGKELANDFTRLASLIRNVLNSHGTDQHERLCHLNLELQSVVTNIRELPGLSRFLLPSLFSDLQRAASGGPVIIVNASKYSCDALLILLDRDPVHIPLQITVESVRELSQEVNTLTVRATRTDVTKELAAFLRKLWDQIISPIVDFLQKTIPPQSRIWWCPTAESSVLPLHAAGPYRKGQRNLSNLFISSYTPTLTALIRAGRHAPLNSNSQGKHLVAIGQAKNAGETELLSVGAELDIIGQRVDALATFTCLDGEQSCISRVVEELGKNEWVHLACHGLPNRTHPFESAFALQDGRFTIQRIIGCDLKNPEFAYLSACHTTVGDKESPDEVIHLASAMQFVGFRSVIGTMWAVDDGETNKITSTFYKYMVDESGRLDHTRAAFALNKTMEESVRIVPLDQRILYIHLGA
ncbi:CHAT domain-containing protein [Boletus edulis BED1]|uniref:CHAT domain-containing protein n=1 Tax=Boletus edulis BED1 TaxID=1328754 RepID=A0AAD4BH29_BOLED|nr:CHAT domain-containing protein [Boletus edulis BED1]